MLLARGSFLAAPNVSRRSRIGRRNNELWAKPSQNGRIIVIVKRLAREGDSPGGIEGDGVCVLSESSGPSW
jgi:hypothetical protein